jgi:formylglycine-generating enzyme required for sulfatase activity
MHPVRLLLVTAVTALVAVPTLPARQAPKAQKAILQLFVDEFVELTPGKGKFPASFEMGSAGDQAPAAEKPAVKVTFKQPFAIAKYEVTQELYLTVLGKNASRWRGPRNSVEKISCLWCCIIRINDNII